MKLILEQIEKKFDKKEVGGLVLPLKRETSMVFWAETVRERPHCSTVSMRILLWTGGPFISRRT